MSNILVIPRYQVIIRFIEIPSVDDTEIEKMVGFQAIREVPYPKEDMIFSYRNLGSFKDGFSSIMLAIAKKQMIEEMVRKSDFNVESIRLFTELLYLFLLIREIIKTESVNLIMHISKTDLELMIVDKTRPIFSRGFKNTDRFLDDLDHSFLAYERDRNNPAIENIIITHPSNVNIDVVRAHIEDRFKLPVSFFEYTEDLSSTDLPAEIDLLPKEFGEKNIRLRKKRELLVTYFLTGLIIILFFASLSFKFYEKEKLLERISLRTEKIRPMTEKLDRLLKKVTIAENHRKEGQFIIDILKHSYEVIPANISLSGLSYDGAELISYKGTSKDMSNIFAFVKTLERSNYFVNVEVKYATKKKIRREELIDFNVQCWMGKDI